MSLASNPCPSSLGKTGDLVECVRSTSAMHYGPDVPWKLPVPGKSPVKFELGNFNPFSLTWEPEDCFDNDSKLQ